MTASVVRGSAHWVSVAMRRSHAVKDPCAGTAGAAGSPPVQQQCMGDSLGGSRAELARDGPGDAGFFRPRVDEVGVLVAVMVAEPPHVGGQIGRASWRG